MKLQEFWERRTLWCPVVEQPLTQLSNKRRSSFWRKKHVEGKAVLKVFLVIFSWLHFSLILAFLDPSNVRFYCLCNCCLWWWYTFSCLSKSICLLVLIDGQEILVSLNQSVSEGYCPSSWLFYNRFSLLILSFWINVVTDFFHYVSLGFLPIHSAWGSRVTPVIIISSRSTKCRWCLSMCGSSCLRWQIPVSWLLLSCSFGTLIWKRL